ncbi:hypothetical protein [Paraburkholderia sp. J11-2]|uniref:hypothetical protein n=1 Tax=Paraburkholderia sp. J11-2 TaxID=2805431 RepID=UPI002AB60A4E|nr:hypothetical protein [Paraburkholderia sp. J11-2]
MPNVVIEIAIDPTTPTVSVQAAAGTSFAGFKITPSDATVAPQVVTAAPWSAVFAVNAGSLSATAQSVDATGKLFGPVFTSNTITVEADISVAIPNVTTLTVALSQ